MRLVTLAPALIALAACGGTSDDSTGPTASCDDYTTALMPTLTPDQFPDGLDAGITALQNLEGLWQGTHCLDPTRTLDVKITAIPQIPDEIQVVQSAPDQSAQCGCGADPNFAHDNTLDIVALVPPFTLSVIPQEVAPIDVSVDNREFSAEGALFGGANGLLFRACDTYQVEPYLNSTYDTVAVNIRLETVPETEPLAELGTVTFGMQLIEQSQGAQPLVCEVTDFRKISGR